MSSSFRFLVLLLALLSANGCTTATEREVSRKMHVNHATVIVQPQPQSAPSSNGIRILKVERRSKTAEAWRKMIRQKSVLLNGVGSAIVFRGQVAAPQDAFVLMGKGADLYALVYVDHGVRLDAYFSIYVPETGQTIVPRTRKVIVGDASTDYLINLNVQEELLVSPGKRRSLVFVVTPAKPVNALRIGLLPLRMDAKLGRLIEQPLPQPEGEQKQSESF